VEVDDESGGTVETRTTVEVEVVENELDVEELEVTLEGAEVVAAACPLVELDATLEEELEAAFSSQISAASCCVSAQESAQFSKWVVQGYLLSASAVEHEEIMQEKEFDRTVALPEPHMQVQSVWPQPARAMAG
jgi:hypothetical protein